METLRDKYTTLEEQVVAKIGELLQQKGVNCTTQSQTEVLRILNEDMMENLDGCRYLVELNETTAFDNKGYTYALSCISLEKLCEIVDSIEESCYDFRVGKIGVDGQRLFKYFDDKEKAYEFFIEVRAKIIDSREENGEVWTEERREDGDYESGDYYSINEDELEEE
jgi:predicted DNA-binding WGR domain protein